jgi:TolB-like protein
VSGSFHQFTPSAILIGASTRPLDGGEQPRARKVSGDAAPVRRLFTAPSRKSDDRLQDRAPIQSHALRSLRALARRAEERVQRRLAAILAADVVGYSRHMEQDEVGTLAALKERRRSILTPLISRHQGRVVKVMGDGVLVEFASAVNAVQCGVELQGAMLEANSALPEERRVVLRIGINLGDIIVEGTDLYGDGVNVAARLESLAEPGDIYISRSVYDQVRRKLSIDFDEIGPQTIKNIAEPVHVYHVRRKGEAGTVRPALALPDKPSIAVLPFENMSGDREQEYFADGMVEEIITALSRFRNLFVIARNSSFTYKGRAVNVKQIASDLGVRYVLEGSVRKAANRVRITGQLVDATTGSHIWADRFEGGLEDIFDLQDQVTTQVVGAIAPKLEEAEIERANRKPTESLDAYDYYLRGMSAFYHLTAEGNGEAFSHFYGALEIDPNYALAYAMAARTLAQRKAFGWSTDLTSEIAETERLARKGAKLSKDDPVVLTMAGIALAYVVGDLDSGDTMIDRALALNPNLAGAWLFGGWVKVWLGEPDVAIDRLSRAMRLSPQDPNFFNMQAATAGAHFVAGRYDEALSWATAAVKSQPNYVLANTIAAASAAMCGHIDQARNTIARLRELVPLVRVSKLTELLPIRRPEHLARLADGLREAGLPE